MRIICPKCGAKSVALKVHTRKDGYTKKFNICYTKGCGYVNDLTPEVPSASEVKKEKERQQGQREFVL